MSRKETMIKHRIYMLFDVLDSLALQDTPRGETLTYLVERRSEDLGVNVKEVGNGL